MLMEGLATVIGVLLYRWLFDGLARKQAASRTSHGQVLAEKAYLLGRKFSGWLGRKGSAHSRLAIDAVLDPVEKPQARGDAGDLGGNGHDRPPVVRRLDG